MDSDMKRIQEVIKKKAREYRTQRVYVNHQIQYFLMVTLLLILMGMFVEFGYYSTIGQLGNQIAFEIVKVHLAKLVIILGYAFFIDWIAAFIVGALPQNVKERFVFPLQRPTFLNTTLLILMLSLDAPISVFCIAITVIAFLSQNTRHGYTFYCVHPVLIAYIISVLGIMATNYNLGLTELSPSLTAPYSVSVNEIYSTFKQHYYSMSNVVFGLFEGAMCYTLVLPLCLSALFLMKRRVIDYRVVFSYITGYVLMSALLGIIFKQSPWSTGLFLLNGSVLMSGIFIVPDAVTLSQVTSFKYGYAIGASLLTAIGCYFVHFVFAPYLVLLVLQILIFWIAFIKKFKGDGRYTSV